VIRDTVGNKFPPLLCLLSLKGQASLASESPSFSHLPFSFRLSLLPPRPAKEDSERPFLQRAFSLFPFPLQFNFPTVKDKIGLYGQFFCNPLLPGNYVFAIVFATWFVILVNHFRYSPPSFVPLRRIASVLASDYPGNILRASCAFSLPHIFAPPGISGSFFGTSNNLPFRAERPPLRPKEHHFFLQMKDFPSGIVFSCRNSSF